MHITPVLVALIIMLNALGIVITICASIIKYNRDDNTYRLQRQKQEAIESQSARDHQLLRLDNDINMAQCYHQPIGEYRFTDLIKTWIRSQ